MYLKQLPHSEGIRKYPDRLVSRAQPTQIKKGRSSAMAAKTETAESAAFRSLYSEVADCLEHQESPSRVAHNLYPLGLITRSKRDDVSYASSPSEKVGILLRAVESKIRSNPDNFDRFVDYLATEKVNEDIVKKLRKARKEARRNTGTLLCIYVYANVAYMRQVMGY